MTTAEHREALRALWLGFVRDDARDYSPLYAAIGTAVAADDELLDLVAAAPPHAHLPLSLLAAVHYLVLADPSSPLAEAYDGRRPRVAAPALFRELCRDRREEIAVLLATRRIQTNECGRSGALALGLAAATSVVGPIGMLVDAGASAGLNLRFDGYHLDYGELGARGSAQAAAVRVECAVTGLDRLPDALPAPATRVGVDRSPVDVTDDDQARWLLAACGRTPAGSSGRRPRSPPRAPTRRRWSWVTSPTRSPPWRTGCRRRPLRWSSCRRSPSATSTWSSAPRSSRG